MSYEAEKKRAERERKKAKGISIKTIELSDSNIEKIKRLQDEDKSKLPKGIAERMVGKRPSMSHCVDYMVEYWFKCCARNSK